MKQLFEKYFFKYQWLFIITLIVLLVPRVYRGRSQTRANAGAGNRKGWYVLNCLPKMTD
jgi:hypothetical protein